MDNSSPAVVYMATFENGKSYIGKTTNFDKRKKQHLYESKTTDHSVPPFHRAIRKFGEPNYAIIWEGAKADYGDAETRLIRERGTLVPNGYNVIVEDRKIFDEFIEDSRKGRIVEYRDAAKQFSAARAKVARIEMYKSQKYLIDVGGLTSDRDKKEKRLFLDSFQALLDSGMTRFPFDRFALGFSINKDVMIYVGEREGTKWVFQVYSKGESLFRISPKMWGWIGDIELNDDFSVTPKQTMLTEDMQNLAEVLAFFLVSMNTSWMREEFEERGGDRVNTNQSQRNPSRYIYIPSIATVKKKYENNGYRHVRVHLRGGHIRNQKYGKGLSETKKIFIESYWAGRGDRKVVEKIRKVKPVY